MQTLFEIWSKGVTMRDDPEQDRREADEAMRMARESEERAPPASGT